MTDSLISTRIETPRPDSTFEEILEVKVPEAEAAELGALAEDLEGQFSDADNIDLLRLARCLEVPATVARCIKAFSSEQATAVLLKQIIEIDDDDLGDTPSERLEYPDPARKYGALLAAIGAHLGEPIRWRNRAGGHLIAQVLPTTAAARSQTGASSETTLLVHVEDAYATDVPDTLCLFGLRNPSATSTCLVLGSDLVAALDDDDLSVLGMPRFRARQDASYRAAGDTNAADRLVAPIKLGRRPELRFDVAECEPLPGDAEAAVAWANLQAAAQLVQRDVTIEAGDLLIVANRHAAHGRAPFHAEFAGRDRWVLQLLVAKPRA
jgi:hypothetical protein